MKLRSFPAPAVAALTLIFASGCATNPSDTRLTNQTQPGPAVGRAVGTVAGAVVGNAAGAVAGAAEGAVDAAEKPFHKPDRRVVRTWRTETTADGRTIKVPVDTEVDEYGRPIGAPATPASP